MFSSIRSSLGAALLLGAICGSPAFAAGACGNGLLEEGESCAACAADCAPAACKPGDPQRVALDLTTPSGTHANALILLLGYRTDRLTLGASGDGAEVKRRLEPRQPVLAASANNLGNAVRVVLVNGSPFADGEVATVQLDRCAGDKAVAADDLRCVVEGCSGGGGRLDGCRCAVRTL